MTRSLDEVAGALEMYVEMVGVVIGGIGTSTRPQSSTSAGSGGASRSGLVPRHGDRSSRNAVPSWLGGRIGREDRPGGRDLAVDEAQRPECAVVAEESPAAA
jgi:hypothetical protein